MKDPNLFLYDEIEKCASDAVLIRLLGEEINATLYIQGAALRTLRLMLENGKSIDEAYTIALKLLIEFRDIDMSIDKA